MANAFSLEGHVALVTVDAVECAVRAQSFDAGLAAAKRLHDRLAESTEGTARAELETPP